MGNEGDFKLGEERQRRVMKGVSCECRADAMTKLRFCSLVFQFIFCFLLLLRLCLAILAEKKLIS